MHRNDLLLNLANYASAWPEEQETTRRFITFVEAHADCFERHLQIGHITGSAWVEIDQLAEFTPEESMLRMAKKWRAR